MDKNTKPEVAAAPAVGELAAWSPMSKTGLLRGIRVGKPSEEDLAIAEADGDTIKYFVEAAALSALSQSRAEIIEWEKWGEYARRRFKEETGKDLQDAAA